jgi:DNA polymerase
MTEEERRGLWRELSLLEDWSAGGIRISRTEPDFSVPPPSAQAAAPGPGRQPGPASRAAAPAACTEELSAICAEVSSCAKCRLGAGRIRAVCGMGAERPLVLVVGEGPGAEEDAQGLPFVGPAGKLLDRMLSAVGLSRETNCYIANVVKCRPPMNRDPAPDEQEACIGYLRRQIAVLQPRVILCVGRVATQALTGWKEGINRLRGRWLSFDGLPLIATFHPSALLRDETLKRPAWEDLKKLREALQNPDGSLDGPGEPGNP